MIKIPRLAGALHKRFAMRRNWTKSSLDPFRRSAGSAALSFGGMSEALSEHS